MTDLLRVGTRGSPLALAQADEVVRRLRATHPEVRCETVVVRTHGDEGYREDLGTGLDGKRAFTKRIEDELLSGAIDCAVHSLKDLPTGPVEGLALAAVPPRGDPRDVLVAHEGLSSDRLPPGTHVGTSSLRRRAQLLARWPGLRVEELHGNVGTRLRRLDERQFDAVVVAAAGLHRLDLTDRRAEPLASELMTPSPGQGALAVEVRSDDRAVRALLASIDDPVARRETEAERELSERLGGGCNVPFGALARLASGRFDLVAVVASPDGRRMVRARSTVLEARWKEGLEAAWTQLVEGGAREILAEAS